MGVDGQMHILATSRQRKRPNTHCTGGWVDHKTSLDGCEEEVSSPLGFKPRTVQPVVSCHTNYATPALPLYSR